MILAAGRGERMRELTADRPKPLLAVGEYTLIEHQIHRLVAAGIDDLIVNLAYLGHLIRAHLGDGSRFGVRIRYSDEGEAALGTGGGIRRALPLLGSDPFLVVNADVWTDFPYATLTRRPVGHAVAHLVLVPNPAHVPSGDFALDTGIISRDATRHTFSGIGVYHPSLFQGDDAGAFSLVAPLDRVMPARRVHGERYDGLWIDVGTPERLADLRSQVSSAAS